MAEFIRARSDEQKALRMGEIKAAADAQFATHPYHEITLTTIAEELSWSRANLYKYVTTKEEIFLALARDKYAAYCEDLLEAFPEGAHLSHEEAAKLWANIVNEHLDWFKLHDLLVTIFESNASVESLKGYKQTYYSYREVFQKRLPETLGVPKENVDKVMLSIMNQASGLICTCGNPEVLAQVLAELGVTRTEPNVPEEMYDFVFMCLEHWASKQLQICKQE